MDNIPLLDYSTAQGLLWPDGQPSPFQEDDRRPWLADPSLFREGQLANPFLEDSGIYKNLCSGSGILFPAAYLINPPKIAC
jgi:hypothetical protein